VREHRSRECLDVVGDHVVPAVEGGPGPAGPQQLQGRPGRGPEPQFRRDPGGRHQRDDVLLHRRGDQDTAHRGDQVPDVEGRGDRFQLVQRRCRAVRGEHLQLGGRGRVPDGDAGGEPVALSLGQGICALHLDRVLRGEHHERGFQPVGRAVHRDVPLLHAFQQGGLGFRRGPVDLVPDDEVGEDGAGLEFEVAAFLVVGTDPRDVAGQQIGRELDPAHRAVDRLGQGLGQHRLPHARHVLDEQVPLGEQNGEGQPDDVRLAVDDGLDGGADALGPRDEVAGVPRPSCLHNQQVLLGSRSCDTAVATLRYLPNIMPPGLVPVRKLRAPPACPGAAQTAAAPGAPPSPTASPTLTHPSDQVFCGANCARGGAYSVDGGGLWGRVGRGGVR